MKNISKIIIATIISLIFYSCNKDDSFVNDSQADKIERQATFNNRVYSQNEINNEFNKLSKKDINKVFNHFGISKIINIEKGSKIYENLNIETTSEIKEYVMLNSDFHFYVVENYRKFDLYKTTKTKGKIEIVQKFTFDIDEKFNVKLIDIYDFDSNTNVYNKRKWCQREGNETQSQCEDREYDEFVDGDWVAWVAWHTNPGISLLVSVMCMC